MLTDAEIQDLINSPKEIIQKTPATGYKQEDTQKRCDLTLKSSDSEEQSFSVFIRQNNKFIENYSIGLRYKTQDKDFGSVTLIRYNGSHGEKSRHADGHYNKPHIHRITTEEMKSGSNQPQESHREITDKYNTFEEALWFFFGEMCVTNWQEYFPELKQRSLFNGHE